jgi:DNA-binding ferritin-like protein
VQDKKSLEELCNSLKEQIASARREHDENTAQLQAAIYAVNEEKGD